MRILILAICALAAVLPGAARSASPCQAESGPHRVALLELYTSEGCDSCPPTDRWLSSLPGRGFGPDRIVALGFHVDYWNYLGWADPFARAEYSARQRAASRRNQARFVYTPQLLLNGKDFRRGLIGDGLEAKLRDLNRQPSRVRIRVSLGSPSPAVLALRASVDLPDTVERRDAGLYYALYENRLGNDVNAGENRGKRLEHDFVVRALSGPFALDTATKTVDHSVTLKPGWKRANLRVAAFVQNQRTGDVLQALSTPLCENGEMAAGRRR